MTLNGIDIEIEYKPIKHIHLAVYPPNGRVHASVPNEITEAQVRMFILSKYTWLTGKIEEAKNHNYQSAREYVSGEAHYFKGELYRLRVDITTSEKQNVYIEGDYIVVACRRKENVEFLLNEWYRARLKETLPMLVEKWCAILNVPLPTYEVKEMELRWGSCNHAKRHIIFNLELAKKPLSCIEYIVAHEAIHLLERTHTARFFRLLDTYLPDWEKTRDLLNEYPITKP